MTEKEPQKNNDNIIIIGYIVKFFFNQKPFLNTLQVEYRAGGTANWLRANDQLISENCYLGNYKLIIIEKILY